jgi:hypothetical protein
MVLLSGADASIKYYVALKVVTAKAIAKVLFTL